MPNILYTVIPCFNEEEVLNETAVRLERKYKELIEKEMISRESRILFVNDGSTDATWEIVKRLHRENPRFNGISLSRNHGHQNALLAGLLYAKDYADMTISMDADLQDDIECIDSMIEQYILGGYDVVFGVRKKRETDSLFKRVTAQGFYKLMNWMGAETVYNHADFRLMSQRAVEALAQFGEVNLFLRGIVPMIGFPSTKVYYERHERYAGKSKYSLNKMMSFAIEGITSFSAKPIRLITVTGGCIFLISVIILFYSFYRHFTGLEETGWASIMASVWAVGGLILLSVGVIGEYIGKIYLESKRRPRFIIDEILD